MDLVNQQQAIDSGAKRLQAWRPGLETVEENLSCGSNMIQRPKTGDLSREHVFFVFHVEERVGCRRLNLPNSTHHPTCVPGGFQQRRSSRPLGAGTGGTLKSRSKDNYQLEALQFLFPPAHSEHIYPDTTNGTAIYAYIGVVLGVNVGIYGIHGVSGRYT